MKIGGVLLVALVAFAGGVAADRWLAGRAVAGARAQLANARSRAETTDAALAVARAEQRALQAQLDTGVRNARRTAVRAVEHAQVIAATGVATAPDTCRPALERSADAFATALAAAETAYTALDSARRADRAALAFWRDTAAVQLAIERDSALNIGEHLVSRSSRARIPLILSIGYGAVFDRRAGRIIGGPSVQIGLKVPVWRLLRLIL